MPENRTYKFVIKLPTITAKDDTEAWTEATKMVMEAKPQQLLDRADVVANEPNKEKNIALELNTFIKDNFDENVFGSDTTYEGDNAFLFEFAYKGKKYNIIFQNS